jgi:hypothetical protein
MIPNIKNGDKIFAKEITTPVSGLTAIAKRKYMPIISKSGPIFPAYDTTPTTEFHSAKFIMT